MSHDEPWWAMMSHDEPWWAMMSNDEQWWAMKTSSVCPISLQASSHPPSVPSRLDGVQFWHGKEHLVKRLGIIQDSNLLWAQSTPHWMAKPKKHSINYLKDGILWTPKNSLDSALAISINQQVCSIAIARILGLTSRFLGLWSLDNGSFIVQKKGSCPNINGYPLVI